MDAKHRAAAGFCGPAAKPWWQVLLFALPCTLAAAHDKPTISMSKLEIIPVSVNYFENSDSVLFLDSYNGNMHHSKDAGSSWARVDAVPHGKAVELVMHPYDRETAFILTESKRHFKTNNRGESWSEFNANTLPSRFQPETLEFHGDDQKRIIFNGMQCDGIFCDETAMYTTDGFDSVYLLREFTAGCRWAKSTGEFTTGDTNLDKTRVTCIIRDGQDRRLVVSDTFFAREGNEILEFEPVVSIDTAISDAVSAAALNEYLLVASSSRNGMALYVTDDAEKWNRAVFLRSDEHSSCSPGIGEGAFAVLEGADRGLHMDVMMTCPFEPPMGALFTSGTNGNIFTQKLTYTNRNKRGQVDFENVSGIPGVYIVNIVENGADANTDGKAIVSTITFDNGEIFRPLKAGNESVHLHFYSEMGNTGRRILLSPVPGLVMGNGNSGDFLADADEANLFVSHDAGRNWKMALTGRYRYEFGAFGSVLVAVKDSGTADVTDVFYSLDYGETWERISLPNGLRVKPELLTTTRGSLKFLLVGSRNDEVHSIVIDFESLGRRACGSNDMEDWNPAGDENGRCLMGRKTYTRRKKTADCFVRGDVMEGPIQRHCVDNQSDFNIEL